MPVTAGAGIRGARAAACGPARSFPAICGSTSRPTLIIEVLSPSSEAYDRGKKFEHYRSIESFVEYLLVSQDEPRIEQYLRQPAGRWLFTAVAGLDATIALPSIQCELALAELYDRVPLG